MTIPVSQSSFSPTVQSSSPSRSTKSSSLWKWLVVGALAVPVVGAGGVAGIFGIAVTTLKNSAPCQTSLEYASHHPQVTAELGAPVEAGWFVQGGVSVTGAEGNSSITIPLSGPRGEGAVHVVAERHSGTWTITSAEFTKDGRSIDITPVGPVATSP